MTSFHLLSALCVCGGRGVGKEGEMRKINIVKNIWLCFGYICMVLYIYEYVVVFGK